MEVFLIKRPDGLFELMDDEQQELFKRFKIGSVIRCNFQEMRNGQFFKKWWALATVSFQIWVETVPNIKHKGVEVKPNFERFRKDLTIMAGHYEPTFNIKNELRLDAKSLQWSKMTEATFNELYQDTITTVLQKVIPARNLTPEQLENWANQTMEFA